MRLPKCRILFGMGMMCLFLCSAALAQLPVRLAVFDLNGDETGEVTALFRALTQAQPTAFEPVEAALIRVAARGAGYDGSLNLQREEARALGLSVGCDFYLLGKVQVGRRLGAENQSYYEALAGLLAVETRTGRLASFVWVREEAAHETEAREKLLASVKNKWTQQVGAILAAREQQLEAIAQVGQLRPVVIEVLNDDQLGPQGEQPVFYQRLKPEYTKEAELAGVTATVELEAVFQADGKIGEVQVTRWAGFGLDEAALATVRKLRFKPAMQAGKAVTIRGLVRYNFRRPSPLAERLEEAERLKRSLRELKSPGITGLPPRPE